MTVTTPVAELLAHARRCEVEQRWAQASASYDEALANCAHSADDRALIEGLRQACIRRSHEMVSLTSTSATEAAKHRIDQQGERAAARRAQAQGDLK